MTPYNLIKYDQHPDVRVRLRVEREEPPGGGRGSLEEKHTKGPLCRSGHEEIGQDAEVGAEQQPKQDPTLGLITI